MCQDLWQLRFSSSSSAIRSEVRSVERDDGGPVQKMGFVANYDSRWIQCQVAIQRETWVIDILRQVENEPCFQTLAGSHFRIEARIMSGVQ